MGKLITFWSPYHGQCRTTASAIAVAGVANGTSVITHIQTAMSNMENIFGLSEQNENGYLNDSGLNNLVYNITARHLDEEDIQSAVIKVTENLSLLPSLGQSKHDKEKDKMIEYLLTTELLKHYKYVFVDLGTESRELAKNIQEKASINFVVLSQNQMLWKKYEDIPNVRYILSDYDGESKYTLRHFKFNISPNAYIIPHCTEYMDAIAAGDVRNFFLRNEMITTKKRKNKGLDNFFQKIKEVKLK